MLNSGSGKEEEQEEEEELKEDSCVSVMLREAGEVERRLRDGRLEVSYQNGNKKIIREVAGVRDGKVSTSCRSDHLRKTNLSPE